MTEQSTVTTTFAPNWEKLDRAIGSFLGDYRNIKRLPVADYLDLTHTLAESAITEYHNQLTAAGFIIAPAADVQALARKELAERRFGQTNVWDDEYQGVEDALEQAEQTVDAIPTERLAHLAGEGGGINKP